MKFVCKNPNCEKYGVEVERHATIYKIVNGRFVSEDAPCPKCGQLREELNPNESLSPQEKGVSMGMYSSQSKEGRTEMLKKRAHDHFEKEVKPFKEHQINEAVKNMQDYKKG